MNAFILGVLMANTDGPATLDLKEVQARLVAVWHNGELAKNYRSRVRTQSKLIKDDLATTAGELIGTSGFRGPKGERLTGPLETIDDIARLGPLERMSGEGRLPVGNFMGSGQYRVAHMARSPTDRWDWHAYDRTASRSGSADIVVILGDWYSGMIGMPRVALERFVKGFSGPFGLLELIPSGQYRLAATPATVGGERCVVLERPGLDRLWLAPDKGYALVQREFTWHAKGPIKRRIVNRDLRRVHADLWLPHACKMEVYGAPATAPNQLCATYEVDVLLLDFNVAPEWFDLTREFPEGTAVRDYVDNVEYTVGRDAAGRLRRLNPRLPPQAARGAGPVARGFERLGAAWLWGAAGGLLLLLALWLKWRQSKATS